MTLCKDSNTILIHNINTLTDGFTKMFYINANFYHLRRGIKFELNKSLYLKDPQDTDYGHKLLENSIELMVELGFESFTFKKLANRIQSTETSVYRYFENKHYLLLYLTCWYWEWVHFLIDMNMRNIDDPWRRLSVVIHNIVNASTESPMTEYINENLLHQLIINEGTKAYHVHNIDKENKMGFFASYEDVVNKVANVILEIKPSFEYSRSLATNFFEMANNEIFFAEHIPQLTNISMPSCLYTKLEEMMTFYAQKILA